MRCRTGTRSSAPLIAHPCPALTRQTCLSHRLDLDVGEGIADGGAGEVALRLGCSGDNVPDPARGGRIAEHPRRADRAARNGIRLVASDDLVCRLLLEKKKNYKKSFTTYLK